jgi:hypothetical protein
MGCGCKTNQSTNLKDINVEEQSLQHVDDFINDKTPKKYGTKKYFRYLFNFIIFLFSILFLPIIIIAIIWIMFKFLVLNENIDIAKSIKILSHKIKFANYDEEDLKMIYGEYDEEEYEYGDIYKIEELK